MRKTLIAITIAGVLGTGAAHATPTLGAAAHELGGAVTPASDEGRPLTVLEVLLGFMGLSASVQTLASEEIAKRDGRNEPCPEAKKTEVAKAEAKEDDASTSKGRGRPGEPVYLAF